LNPQRVRVYADPDLVPAAAPHVPFLEPLWGPGGDKYEDPRSPISGRFEAWRVRGRELVEEAPLHGADVAVLPAGWEHYARVPERVAAAEAYAERVREAGKPLVVFFVGDSTDAVPLLGAHVYRTSLLRSRRREREHVLPAFARDVAEELGGPPPLRPWRERPVAGFCGYAPDRGLRGFARRILGRTPHPAAVRTAACRALRRSRLVDTRFVFRPAYWAGALDPRGELDYEAMHAARQEFLASLIDSDYVLAVRGGGNFSVRFYEALSCARIPIFLDTDSPLPYENELDWRSLCVWLDESELPEIGAKVARFHAALDPEEFAERQRACRRVYLERLTPQAFFTSLVSGCRGLAP
jgi:hypothetical protein